MDLTPANVRRNVEEYHHCDGTPECNISKEGRRTTVTTEERRENSGHLLFVRSIATQTIETEKLLISKQHPALNQLPPDLAVLHSGDRSVADSACLGGEPEVLNYSTARVASVSEREITNFHKEADLLKREQAVCDRENKVMEREEAVFDREEKVTKREEEVLDREQKVTKREVAVLGREESVEKREKAVLEYEKQLKEVGNYIQEKL